MPTDQLKGGGRSAAPYVSVSAPADPHEIADGVLAVLAGAPLDQVANRLQLEPGRLVDAIETFQAAGRTALQAQASFRDWHQILIRFSDWNAAERIAIGILAPQLLRMESSGDIAAWWFIRKPPCWRIRLQAGGAIPVAQVRESITPVLDTLAARGHIERWYTGIYEPETIAFGGPDGLHAAHQLFHADSRGILDYLPRVLPGPGGMIPSRRELSILLIATFVRSAGQDWYEHGDVWHKVTRLRPLPATPDPRMTALMTDIRPLMTADTRGAGSLFNADGPLAFATGWVTAFQKAGETLGAAAQQGRLDRGLRHILAHHVIFHWNRIGLPTRTQSILARAARDTVMNPPKSSSDAEPTAGP
jgi:thiopeptide-type bacteriocin biosynthesis protein